MKCIALLSKRVIVKSRCPGGRLTMWLPAPTKFASFAHVQSWCYSRGQEHDCSRNGRRDNDGLEQTGRVGCRNSVVARGGTDNLKRGRDGIAKVRFANFLKVMQSLFECSWQVIMIAVIMGHEDITIHFFAGAGRAIGSAVVGI